MTQATENTMMSEQAVRPAVDMYSTAEAVHVLVDLPGVEKAAVQVTLEGKELLLEAEATEPEGVHVGGARLPRRYRRVFALSDLVDRSRIAAKLSGGVLELTLPKSEQLRPRTIPIEEP